MTWMRALSRRGIQMKTCTFLVMVAALFACGGKAPVDGETTDGGTAEEDSSTRDLSPFVGTWTCQDTSLLETVGGTTSSTDIVVVLANSNGTLTVTIGSSPDDAGGACGPYSYTFSVSGSVATGIGGLLCNENSDVYTFESGTFFVSGNSATISIKDSESGPHTIPGMFDITGTCTKN
jgi:hypothetical protein